MDKKPEELLQAAWVEPYQRIISVLHNQLARVRSTLFVLEHVARFPFDIFGENRGPFWELVRRSLETTVVMGLWRILIDTNGKSLTLKQLKNLVLSNALDEPAREVLAKRLRTVRVEERISVIEERVSLLRNKHLAHLDRALATGDGDGANDHTVSFRELSELTDTAHELINALGIGTQFMTLYPDYDPSATRGGQKIKPDVEQLFDDMVMRSTAIRMPEEKPGEFPFFWKHRSPQQRKAYNAYRKKLGMPEVPEDS